jgi:GxxExxY protein
MTENDISYKCIGAAIALHKNIGPGLLKSAYENALVYDLTQLGLNVEQQVPMTFVYKEVRQNIGYRLDLIINKKVIIEIKAIESLLPVHYSQLLTYL